MSVQEQHVFDQIRAVGDITIAEQLDPIKQSAGGIILPDMSQQAPVYWKVISVGPAVTAVKVGERVIFTSGSRVEFEGRTIVALRPADILGTLPLPKEASRLHDPTRF